jgi:hypothetical protein
MPASDADGKDDGEGVIEVVLVPSIANVDVGNTVGSEDRDYGADL